MINICCVVSAARGKLQLAGSLVSSTKRLPERLVYQDGAAVVVTSGNPEPKIGSMNGVLIPQFTEGEVRILKKFRIHGVEAMMGQRKA